MFAKWQPDGTSSERPPSLLFIVSCKNDWQTCWARVTQDGCRSWAYGSTACWRRVLAVFFLICMLCWTNMSRPLNTLSCQFMVWCFWKCMEKWIVLMTTARFSQFWGWFVVGIQVSNTFQLYYKCAEESQTVSALILLLCMVGDLIKYLQYMRATWMFGVCTHHFIAGLNSCGFRKHSARLLLQIIHAYVVTLKKKRNNKQQRQLLPHKESQLGWWLLKW